MMKLVLMLALVGACAGVPVAQDGARGDEPTNVLIHSGYANIRRQGRMHDSGAFGSQRFKKGRTLDVDAIKSDSDKVDPAPVFKGFSDEEYQSEETQELKEKVEAASKLAIEKMEKDIMNAITSIPSENVNEATTQSFQETTASEEEVVTISENTIEETTTSHEVPTTNTPIASADTTLASEVTEKESEKEEEEVEVEVTTISEEVPATNTPIAASTSIPESTATEIISQEATTTIIDEATTTTNKIITTSEADSEKTTYTPIASTQLDIEEEVPVSTTITSQNQQPSEDLDLGSVEEVIS